MTTIISPRTDYVPPANEDDPYGLKYLAEHPNPSEHRKAEALAHLAEVLDRQHTEGTP